MNIYYYYCYCFIYSSNIHNTDITISTSLIQQHFYAQFFRSFFLKKIWMRILKLVLRPICACERLQTL